MYDDYHCHHEASIIAPSTTDFLAIVQGLMLVKNELFSIHMDFEQANRCMPAHYVINVRQQNWSPHFIFTSDQKIYL
jgi:hypothetical protein